MSPPTIGFVGAGRLAKGLAVAMDAAGVHVVAAASRSLASAEALATLIPGCEATDAAGVAARAELILLSVPDDAIAEAAATLPAREGQGVVHCSGVTEVAALDAVASRGLLTGGFHPMQGFADPKAAARSLRGCTVTIEASPPLESQLVTLAEALGCRVNRLPPGRRDLYHAVAGYGSQFLNVLLAEAATHWKAWGASERDVIAAFLPMMRGTLDAIEAGGIAEAMPGPVSRGDASSVGKHVDALEGEALAFYRAHCLRSVELARLASRIDEDTAARLRAILVVQ